MRTKFYLSSRFARKDELRGYAADLIDKRHSVTSTWLMLDNDDVNQYGYEARADLDDIRRSDIIINFTEAPNTVHSTGGRHVEHGYALAYDKKQLFVGPRENLFHHLPRFANCFFPDWESLLVAVPNA